MLSYVKPFNEKMREQLEKKKKRKTRMRFFNNLNR